MIRFIVLENTVNLIKIKQPRHLESDPFLNGTVITTYGSKLD